MRSDGPRSAACRTWGRSAAGTATRSRSMTLATSLGYADTAGGETRAFLWTASGGMKDLGGKFGWGVAINAAGQVTGYASLTGGSDQAFRWTPSAGAQDLGTLGGNGSQGNAINDAGQVQVPPS